MGSPSTILLSTYSTPITRPTLSARFMQIHICIRSHIIIIYIFLFFFIIIITSWPRGCTGDWGGLWPWGALQVSSSCFLSYWRPTGRISAEVFLNIAFLIKAAKLRSQTPGLKHLRTGKEEMLSEQKREVGRLWRRSFVHQDFCSRFTQDSSAPVHHSIRSGDIGTFTCPDPETRAPSAQTT